MNNLEKLIKDFEAGETLPLIGTFMMNGENCDFCAAKEFCHSDESAEMGGANTRAYWLLMEYVEPDSLEKIAADAKKSYIGYWGCQGFCCQDCPAVIDGETPSERFSGYGCDRAMAFDVFRRLNALDAS